MARNTVYVLGLDYTVRDEIGWDKAVTHILAGSATPFQVDAERRVRSANGTVDMPWPLIIRLNYWKPVPNLREINLDSRATSSQILRRDGYTCAYCGEYATTADHIYPKSRGGGWTWGNLVAACESCNSFKADRTPEEAGMKLLWMPHANNNRFAGVQAKVWKILDAETFNDDYNEKLVEAVMFEGMMPELRSGR